MAIVGIGLDVTELRRIERIWLRFGHAFARRVLTDREFGRLPATPIAFLASRFAAKEAAVKALGTGFTGGVTFQQIEIASRASGQPDMVLHGRARARAEALGVTDVHLSLSHGRDVAAAVVILENQGA